MRSRKEGLEYSFLTSDRISVSLPLFDSFNPGTHYSTLCKLLTMGAFSPSESGDPSSEHLANTMIKRKALSSSSGKGPR